MKTNHMFVTTPARAPKVHERLTDLIKKRFGVYLEINHRQYPSPDAPYSAVTTVMAFRSLVDARSGVNPLGQAQAKCVRGDQFVRAKGLEIALRRLYRDLAAKIPLADITNSVA